MTAVALLGMATVSAAEVEANEYDAAAISTSAKHQLESADYAAGLMAMPDEVIESIKGNPEKLHEWATRFHTQKILYQEAAASGLDQRADIQARIAQSTRQIVVEVLSAELEKQYRESAPDLEPLARETYHSAPDVFKLPEQRRFAHILLKWSIDNNAAAKAEIEKKFADIRRRLDDGENFAQLAREYSEDPGSVRDGGLLPGAYQRDGELVPEFLEAGFALKEAGDFSELVETKFGLHLIALVEIIPAHTVPFAEAKGIIIEQEMRTYVRQKLSAYQNERAPFWDSIQMDQLSALVEQEVSRRFGQQSSEKDQ